MSHNEGCQNLQVTPDGQSSSWWRGRGSGVERSRSLGSVTAPCGGPRDTSQPAQRENPYLGKQGQDLGKDAVDKQLNLCFQCDAEAKGPPRSSRWMNRTANCSMDQVCFQPVLTRQVFSLLLLVSAFWKGSLETWGFQSAKFIQKQSERWCYDSVQAPSGSDAGGKGSSAPWQAHYSLVISSKKVACILSVKMLNLWEEFQVQDRIHISWCLQIQAGCPPGMPDLDHIVLCQTWVKHRGVGAISVNTWSAGDQAGVSSPPSQPWTLGLRTT